MKLAKVIILADDAKIFKWNYIFKFKSNVSVECWHCLVKMGNEMKKSLQTVDWNG